MVEESKGSSKQLKGSSKEQLMDPNDTGMPAAVVNATMHDSLSTHYQFQKAFSKGD